MYFLSTLLSTSKYYSRLYDVGGWLTVLETRDEWYCIKHWVENEFSPVFQRFAIALRTDLIHPGQYLWNYPDGSTTYPVYEEWALSRPQDSPCVSMMIGSGVDHQGQWMDVECYDDRVWAICEKM